MAQVVRRGYAQCILDSSRRMTKKEKESVLVENEQDHWNRVVRHLGVVKNQ